MNIYTEEIKLLGKSAEMLARLEHPDSSHTGSNPVCGDRVIIDLHRYSDHIDADPKISIGFEVRGCLICKVSAALVDQHCNNRTAREIQHFSNVLKQILLPNEEHQLSTVLLPDLSILKPMAEHRHRHNCATLPIKTLFEALGAIS